MEHAGVVTNVVPASVTRDRGPPRVSRHRCLCCCASGLLTSAGCRAAGSGQLTAPEVGGRRRSKLAVGARGGGGNVDRDQGRVGSQSRAQPRDQGVAAELKGVVAGGHKHKVSQKMHAGVVVVAVLVAVVVATAGTYSGSLSSSGSRRVDAGAPLLWHGSVSNKLLTCLLNGSTNARTLMLPGWRIQMGGAQGERGEPGQCH